MSRLLLVFLLLSLSLFAINADYWKAHKESELTRNEVYKSLVTIGERAVELDFRWTLYKNEGLVCHLKYDRVVYQFILYKDHKLDRFILPLAGKRDSRGEREPYLVIRFKDYRRDTRMATVEFFVRDSRGIVQTDLLLREF